MVPEETLQRNAQSSPPRWVGVAWALSGVLRMSRRNVSALHAVWSTRARRAPASPPRAKPSSLSISMRRSVFRAERSVTSGNACAKVLRAEGMITEQAPHLHLQLDGQAACRKILDRSLITAVDTQRGALAIRTVSRLRSDADKRGDAFLCDGELLKVNRGKREKNHGNGYETFPP